MYFISFCLYHKKANKERTTHINVQNFPLHKMLKFFYIADIVLSIHQFLSKMPQLISMPKHEAVIYPKSKHNGPIQT